MGPWRQVQGVSWEELQVPISPLDSSFSGGYLPVGEGKGIGYGMGVLLGSRVCMHKREKAWPLTIGFK